VKITDKISGAEVPFKFNAPQRRVVEQMEAIRKSGRPIRLIMLKARQWGGSTLTQIYMAWMQLVRHKGWNSVICSHVKDSSANIKGMYSRLLRGYPEELRFGENKKNWAFLPFERSDNICYIPARDCRVALTSANVPDAVRGSSFQMAHLSEVAFWGDGSEESAARLVRNVCGSVPSVADSVVVMESTADGERNYFHSEWQRAVEGLSDKTAIFVPWHEIEIYSQPIDSQVDAERLLNSLTPYESQLLNKLGLPLEKMAWYHNKRKEYATDAQMNAEYPTTPQEAFCATNSALLTSSELEKVKIASTPPLLQSWQKDPIVILYLPEDINSQPPLIATARRVGSAVVVGEIEAIEGNYLSITSKFAKRVRGEGGRGLVVNHPDSEVGQEWLARRLEGTRLIASPAGGSTWQLTKGLTAEMHCTWHELIAHGHICEEDAAGVEELRHFRRGDEFTSGSLIVRIAGAYALAPELLRPPLSAADFF
jgi:hypothetical protein